ncbi:MAG: PilC/PilY family type IV pilus protein [Candidatus Aminicenantaceae bacterium]
MKKNKIKIRKGLILFLGTVFVLFMAVSYWAEECTETTLSHIENYETIEYKDEDNSSVEHWGEGYITLNRLGASFPDPQSTNMASWINALTANDFDGDGDDDFIASASQYNNVLAFCNNKGTVDENGKWMFEITHWIDGCEGYDDQTPKKGVGGAALDTYNKHVGLTSGDYDNDGDIDFFFIVGKDNSPWTPVRIWLYENHLADEGVMYFTQTDMTSEWRWSIGGIPMTSTMMESIDFDKDGDIDILVGNGDGEVMLLRNNGTGEMNSNTFTLESTPLMDSGFSNHGITTLSVADFDLDGDLDIFAGCYSSDELRYFVNNGSDVFSLKEVYKDPDGGIDDDDYDGGAAVSICADFDNDGDPDVMIGTDYHYYDGGICYFFRNRNGDYDPEDPNEMHFKSKKIFDMRDDPNVWHYDFDCGDALDYDGDGDIDFLMADGNHTETYYVMTNELANVYNLNGIAVSLDTVDNLDPELYSITRVKINQVDERTIGGSDPDLSIEYYFSNDGGLNWEHYDTHQGSNIKSYSNLPSHSFKHYGTDLRWKAVFSAAEDEMEDFDNASFETPVIDYLEFEYTYVDRREYSRTFIATTVTGDENTREKYLIGGSFYFPGWQGHLRSYNITDMEAVSTDYSYLRTISRSDPNSPSGRTLEVSGVTIEWDAGKILDTTNANRRTIYTAIPSTSSLVRIEFHSNNLAALEPLLQDYNGDNEGLIDFVRGKRRDWKLGDINHSNPAVVGPPDDNASEKGSGYNLFKAAWEDRDKVLFVGTNDGMLHCFDVTTGEELWAFIPYNLLRSLRKMWPVNETEGTRYFRRQPYVDGSPVVEDVYIDANNDGSKEWRTILVCGQGPGTGSTVDGYPNCYFALDVTDISNPHPLWEVSHETMGETWSTPAIGKIVKDGDDTWVAFMGSGYDNVEDRRTGNVFYAVDLSSGEIFWSFDTGEVDTAKKQGWNITNTLPGPPSVLDIDGDGYTDRMYIADLDGRVWKVDTSIEFEMININKATWNEEQIYEDPNNYPIICKPEAWVNPVTGVSTPRVFFGTGGDDDAPADGVYSFIALIDGSRPEVEWYMGDPDVLGLSDEKDRGDLDAGAKVWSNPIIADFTVYFSTLTGSIEDVDPCANLQGSGKLYARYIQAAAGSTIGGTAFTTASGPQESMDLVSKSRAPVTVGEKEKTADGVRKREIYTQEYDSTIEKLEQPTGASLIVRSWREVYKIIK